jgi:hypothetical protein
MTKIFSPPYRIDAFPRSDPRESFATRYARRHWRSEPEGISVWVTTNGAVTTVDPQDASATWYRGGYLYLIDDAAAAVLTNAGYTVNDPPADVVEHIGTVGTPHAPYPVTWDDLAAYTWDEASQFLWGSFEHHV